MLGPSTVVTLPSTPRKAQLTPFGAEIFEMLNGLAKQSVTFRESSIFTVGKLIKSEHTDFLAGTVGLEILGEFAIRSTNEGDMSRGMLAVRDWGCSGDGSQSGNERDDGKLHCVEQGGIVGFLYLKVSFLDLTDC